MKLYWELYIIFNSVLSQFKLLFPYYLLGVAAGSIVSTYARSKISGSVAKLSNNKLSIFALFAAAVLGVVSPICMFGTIPLIAVLGRKGVPQHILAAFMVSSILLNPNLFILSFTLGTKLAVLRLIVCLTGGITAGILVKVFYKNKKLFLLEGFEEDNNCSAASEASFKKLLSNLNKTVIRTAPYLLAGIVLTALFDRYFPLKLVDLAFGQRSLISVFLSAAVGVPLYLCGGGTIPIIRSWLNSGMDPGSAMAFMISGPATKLNNLSAVKIILGAKNFIIYIVYSILFAVVSGMIVNIIY